MIAGSDGGQRSLEVSVAAGTQLPNIGGHCQELGRYVDFAKVFFRTDRSQRPCQLISIYHRSHHESSSEQGRDAVNDVLEIWSQQGPVRDASPHVSLR